MRTCLEYCGDRCTCEKKERDDRLRERGDVLREPGARRRGRRTAAAPKETPAEALRHLLKPGFDAVVMRAEVVAEEMVRAAVNSALEDAAKVAECWRCETHDDIWLHIRERTERQDKVAKEIAAAIRARMSHDQSSHS